MRPRQSWLLWWLLLALPATAQQYPSQARGLGAAVAYQSGDLDHVNLFNGQLSLTLPLGQGYPVGPGLGYGLALTYTSNLWSFNNFRTCSSPGGTTSYYLPEIDDKANAGPGWRVSVGKLEAPVTPDTRWHYFPPDGGEVLLYSTLHPGLPATGAQPNVFFANNGSYLRLRQSSSTSQCHTVPGPSSAWVLGTFTESRVTEAGQTAIEEFCFDTTTGFLERHRTLAGASRANGDLLQVMTPAATGHVATELFYGGDAQGAMDNVYANLCEMSLAGLDAQYQLEHTWAYGSLETTSWINPCDNSLELLAVDNFIDQDTGFISVSRDPAGVATIYDFDAMSRPIAERAAQSAWVEIEYTLPTVSNPNTTPQTLTQTCNNAVTSCAGNDLFGWHRMRYDGLGRPQEEAQRMPTMSGISSHERQFTFNALGWPLTQSAWGDFSKLTTWSGHDRFGRPGQMQLPTESPTRYSYLGERVMTRQEMVATGAAGGETSAYTTEILDGQGRLEQVCENQSSAWTGTCSGTTTRYEYGVTGAMSRVCQNASGASCGQERRFDVDRRGFLLGEKHPEIGLSGNGWSNYSYDALGNVLSRTIAGSADFDLDFRYDAAGRLIKLSERNGPNGPRLLKEFFYGHQNNGNDKRAGKLTMSRRHNWVDPVGPLEATGSLDLVVTQSYFYEGRDGRVSKRLTSLKVPSITTYAFVTDFNWHPLGVLESLQYPECLHPRCSGRAPPRNVSYSYTRGFQTAVPGYASSITYQGGGMLHQVQHTNGVTYTVERESASAIDRPHRISTNRGLDTGIYAYDGAGNVKQIGTQDFRYDRFKRMTSGEVTVSGVDRIQSASYDVYNNLLSLTTNGSTLTTSINSATNRLTSFSATYDAAGNLTRQIRGSETHQYTYDPLGMPKYLQSTTDQAQVHLYDADDERLATYDCFPNVCNSPGWELRTTVRGLGGEPLREYSTRGTNGWQWVRDYVYRNGGMLAAAEPDGNGGENVYHFHLDHLGTPRQITNASGVQVALHSYYPFGQEATDPAQTGFTKKFTGHERDPNGTGTAGDLDYMHARYCSPTLGRFLSFDPIGGNPRAPQSWNRYAYALNSPMNFTDPMGMKPVATFKDEIFVFDTAPIGFEIPSWVLSNWFVDAGSHFDNSRFDFSEQVFSGWEGWDQQGCDEWCQIFAEVGQASTATNFLELGVTTLFERMVLGPLSSKGGDFIRTTVASRYETLEKAAKLKYPKKAGRLENHHKRPIYLGGDRKGETVKIDAAYHQAITNEFRRISPYGHPKPNQRRLEEIVEEVYRTFPLPGGK